MYDDIWVCLKMAYSPNIAVVGNMGNFPPLMNQRVKRRIMRHVCFRSARHCCDMLNDGTLL